MLEIPLREEAPRSLVVPSSFSIDNMTWWFWIKAGMGLFTGFVLMGMVLTIVWFTVIAAGFAAIGSLIPHR